MKKTFQGIECKDLNEFFGPGRTREKAVFAAAIHRDAPYRLVIGPNYKCCEYQKKINIFSFGKAKLFLTFTVIAPPVSIDTVGYFGDITSLIADYSRRKGLFLILNERNRYEGPVAVANTLATAIFRNGFSNFDEYLQSLRSHYRRRLHLALSKGELLLWKQVPSHAFDQELYKLYLQVLHHSDFPLETLGMDFFRECPAEVYALHDSDQKPVAFVMIAHEEDTTTFVFGGMDYDLRDTYDLYYNMMIKVLKQGIARGSKIIDFGQTAESTKCRLGCVLEPRFMLFFTSNPVIMFFAKKLIRLIGYKPDHEIYHVFK
jgi:Acetyltransferase (GNAT) domain